MVIEGATTTAVFEAYIEHVLAPLLAIGDVLVLDNLTAHKSDKVRHRVEAKGAYLLFLPAYSPDLSPIEHAFSKRKQALPRAKAQTFEALIDAILKASPLFLGRIPLVGSLIVLFLTWLSHPDMCCSFIGRNAYRSIPSYVALSRALHERRCGLFEMIFACY